MRLIFRVVFTAIVILAFVQCNTPASVAGEYRYKNARLILRGDSKYTQITDGERIEGRFKVKKDFLLLYYRLYDGTQVVDTYIRDDNKLICTETGHIANDTDKAVYIKY